MWQKIKDSFAVFSTPSALEIAARELAEAERLLLESQTACEYAEAMVTYNTERIRRLRNYVKTSQPT